MVWIGEQVVLASEGLGHNAECCWTKPSAQYMWGAVLKRGRDSSGSWKQTSVIKSLWCLSSSDKGEDFPFPQDGASQEGNNCIAPGSGYYCKDTKRCSLKRLGALTEWTYVSRNSIKRKACLRPHWLIVWSPASAGALSTLCSGAGASTEGNWPFDTSGADHTQKVVVLQQGAPRHCRQSNASVHKNGGMNVSRERSSVYLLSTTVSAKYSFSLPVLNGYMLSWFSNLEAA